MATNAELQDRKTAAIARGVGMMTQIYATKAENAELWDAEDNRYIDFASGIAVLNTGHRHPRIIEAVKAQLDAFTHTCHQVVPYEPYVRLAERLNALVPIDGPTKTIFATTGAEAAENALKIARAHTGRSAAICFTGGFHGRTFMAMAMTGKVLPYKNDFGAMAPDVFHAPFPVPLHGVSVEESLKALKSLFKASVAAHRVAAIVLEPVQGEGGFYQAPPEFMRALREICDDHGILLVADEVQTGFARTGKTFAMDHYDVQPDIMTMAKSLAGGFPLSAVTGRADVMDAAEPGGLGGTYAGSPIGVVAANAVLDVIEEEGLNARAEDLGARLHARIESLRGAIPQIVDNRRLGFMSAIEFNDTGGQPSADFANQVRMEAFNRGLILLTCGVYGNVIRFLSPITIQDEVFAEALDIIEASLHAVSESANSKEKAA